MKNKITHNLTLKIMSVLFAFILWLVVVNLNDPDTSKTIRNIDITILNEEAITGQGQGQIYTVKENRTASVIVKGPRSIVDNMDKSKVKASVDFSEVSSVGAVPINITSLPEGVVVQSKLTENMKIAVEPLETEKYHVSIETQGETAEGYMIGGTEISPNVVSIKAPRSVIEQIKQVLVRVDVDGMSTDINDRSVELVLIDGNGKEIEYKDNEHITFSAATLLVDVSILRTQEAMLQFAALGEVAEGYRYTGLSVTPSGVAIKGSKDKVAGVTVINVPADAELLNVNGLTENTDVEIDILPYLPDGVSLVDEEQRYVTVHLYVEQLRSKTVHIRTGDLAVLRAPEGMDITYEVTGDIMAELTGLEGDLTNLTVSSLAPVIDLNGLTAGTHSCPVTITLPQGVTLQNALSVTVTLSPKEEETTPPEETDGGPDEVRNESSSALPTVPNTTSPTIPVIVKPSTEPEEEATETESTSGESPDSSSNTESEESTTPSEPVGT